MKKKMPFITQTEQLWLDEGLEKGRQETRLATLRDALLSHFGTEGEQIDVGSGTCSQELLSR